MKLILIVFSALLHGQGDGYQVVSNIENRVKYSEPGEAKQEWAYVNVRQFAHMFYWLYYTSSPAGYQNVPLVMWLQGGPGGSSTGVGNFQELGPLDVSLKARNTTWLTEASLLFVDNPVGSGYSFVERKDAYTTDNAMIAKDMIVLLQTFFMTSAKEFQTVPFYIFSESYGGKMTAAISSSLLAAVQSGQIKCNFKGLAMGDSWISPVDSVLTWGPYLYTNSLVDIPGLEAVSSAANKTKQLIDSKQWTEATNQWSLTESTVEDVTNGVNFYNILKWDGSLSNKKYRQDSTSRMYNLMVAGMENDDLSKLMNGPMRKKLKIIPDNVTWGAQSQDVFSSLNEDFMKPVVDIVDDLINNSTLSVIVYSGQLDLIVDTVGTEAWVHRLKISPEYIKKARVAFRDPVSGLVTGYLKQLNNFSFFWVLGAGHMIPTDNGNAALEMLKLIFSA